MKMSYNEILEEICLLQATLSIAFINYDFENIDKTSRKIARLIKKLLDDNKMYVTK